jgi:ankyrin repeat protein
MRSLLSIFFARIGTINRLAPGARLCAGQKGTSRSSHERCDALRLVFDTAALRRRFMEKLKKTSNTLLQLSTVVVTLIIACVGCCSSQRGTYRPIHQYAAEGNAEAVTQDLSTNKCDLNRRDEQGRTPLDYALIHCQTNVVSLLLYRGAKLNVKAQGGATPLHLAAQQGCLDGVELLVAKGAKVNARDDQGKTPLDRALEWQRDAAVQFLRQNGGKE